MSSTFTRKKREVGSIRKSQTLTKRQTGTFLKTLSTGVKSLLKPKEYADYIEQLKKWKLTTPSDDECSINFMENEEGALNFIRKIATTEEKNGEIPTDIIPLPKKGCKQVVFGLAKDLYRYLEHNDKGDPLSGNFIVLAVDGWTEDINIRFLSCSIQNKLKDTCELPIRILIPKDPIMLTRRQNEITKPRITNYELTMFYNALFEEIWDRSMHSKFIKTDENFTYDILLLNTKGSLSGGRSKKHRSKKHRSKKHRSKKHKNYR
jgi:hypothetical protein